MGCVPKFPKRVIQEHVQIGTRPLFPKRAIRELGRDQKLSQRHRG